MDTFTFKMPTRFVFGRDAEDEIGRLVAHYGGTKALILYGGGSVRRSGLLKRVHESLDRALLDYVDLGGGKQNPRVSLVYEGVALARDERVGFVVALGGGSVIDSAKAIAAGACYAGDVWDFYGGDRTPDKALPVGCVPTIAASGSEASPDSVITQDGTMLKRETSADVLLPTFSIMDPVLTETLPAYQTACGIADMYSHLLERYLTHSLDVGITDRMIEGLMISIIEEAPRVMADPHDYQARANLMWAATMAHCNVAGVGRKQDWASHDIEYALSSRYGVAHGAGLAVVMPAVERFYLEQDEHAPALLAQLARRVWQVDGTDDRSAAFEGVNRMREFFRSIGMPVTLEDIGGTAEDIADLAQETCHAGGRTGTVGGYLPLDEEAVRRIFLLTTSREPRVPADTAA